jgi:hypothetical protein
VVTKHKPSRDLLRRHQKAMTLVKNLNEQDRILLLSYVIAPTPRIRDAESARQEAASATS